MRPRHFIPALVLLAILLPSAPPASATPPDTRSAGPPAPARTAPAPPIATKPTAEDGAAAVVEKQLVKPLALKEAKQDRFSRAYVPPQSRQVRVLDHQRSTDSRGAAFVTFSVDERPKLIARKATDESGWRKDAIVGCVYPARDEVFIKRGDRFFGAGLLLGRRTPAADEAVCRPATAATPLPSGASALASATPVKQAPR